MGDHSNIHEQNPQQLMTKWTWGRVKGGEKNGMSTMVNYYLVPKSKEFFHKIRNVFQKKTFTTYMFIK